jgi:transposase
MLSLHRMRALLVKFRTMQVNQLRGLLYEFGATFRAGRAAGLAEIRARTAELEDALPGTMMCCLQDQLRRIEELQRDIDLLEKRIGVWQKHDRRVTRSPLYLASADLPRRRWLRRWVMRRHSDRDVSSLRS